MESVNVEANIKDIGEKILDSFAKEQGVKGINQTENSTEEIKKQIRKDLIYIYYKHDETKNAIFDPENVRDDIKEKILSSWYAALSIRKDIIMNELKFLLENHDKIIPNTLFKPICGDDSDKTTGGNSTFQKELLKQMSHDESDESSDAKDTYQNGDINPENKRGDDFYFEKMVEYKKKLVSNNIVKLKKNKYYASGFQAVKLHQTILNKVIKHYSGIPRNILSTTLRRIVLGDDAIGYISQYKTKKTYKHDPSKKK